VKIIANEALEKRDLAKAQPRSQKRAKEIKEQGICC
jgi:hypothetical protein